MPPVLFSSPKSGGFFSCTRKSMKVCAIVIAVLCAAIIILGLIIRYQNQRIIDIEVQLSQTQRDVDVLRDKASQLSQAIYSLDSALDSYLENQNHAHDDYTESLQKIDTSDPDTRDWLDDELPMCVQDALSRVRLHNTDSPVCVDDPL